MGRTFQAFGVVTLVFVMASLLLSRDGLPGSQLGSRGLTEMLALAPAPPPPGGPVQPPPPAPADGCTCGCPVDAAAVEALKRVPTFRATEPAFLKGGVVSCPPALTDAWVPPERNRTHVWKSR